jgi:hypothetical protein
MLDTLHSSLQNNAFALILLIFREILMNLDIERKTKFLAFPSNRGNSSSERSKSATLKRNQKNLLRFVIKSKFHRLRRKISQLHVVLSHFNPLNIFKLSFRSICLHLYSFIYISIRICSIRLRYPKTVLSYKSK